MPSWQVSFNGEHWAIPDEPATVPGLVPTVHVFAIRKKAESGLVERVQLVFDLIGADNESWLAIYDLREVRPLWGRFQLDAAGAPLGMHNYRGEDLSWLQVPGEWHSEEALPPPF